MSRPRWYVEVLALVLGFLGVIEPHLPEQEPMNGSFVVQTIVMTMLLFHWCKAHASYNAIKPPFGAPVLVALITPIGLPYYAIRGYGFLKGMRLIGLILGWVSSTECALKSAPLLLPNISLQADRERWVLP
jgi:hypothetical protein